MMKNSSPQFAARLFKRKRHSDKTKVQYCTGARFRSLKVMLVTPASRVLLSADCQRDKQFTIEQPIAEDCYMAAEMEGEAALGWYGGFGLRHIW